MEISRDYVILSWEAPESDGGAPITGYNVEKCDMASGKFVPAGSADSTTYKVKRLFEGAEYNFRVAAENRIGQGDYVVLGSPVVCKLPFGK
jgi:titin